MVLPLPQAPETPSASGSRLSSNIASITVSATALKANRSTAEGSSDHKRSLVSRVLNSLTLLVCTGGVTSMRIGQLAPAGRAGR